MIDKFKFHQYIEDFVEENDSDYIDAVIHFCTVYDIEIETIGALITKDLNLVSKIQTEAEALNYLKKTSQLPI
jgi:hypothetical protein